MTDTAPFWESRARHFAGDGAGLRAVCSYAMPGFYNWAIDLTQRVALRGVLGSVFPGAQVLDYGCGVGRWTREFARRGAQVTAVDFSETMLSQARSRTEAAGLSTFCRFIRSDVTALALDRQFDLIVGVTVLQHVLNEEMLAEAVVRLASHLRPSGRLVLLEAAPAAPYTRADTDTFQARPLGRYRRVLEAAGLRVESVQGVDPVPFKLWIVPWYRRWPRSAAIPLLALATVCALPFDLLLARALTHFSWHKIIVARAPE